MAAVQHKFRAFLLWLTNRPPSVVRLLWLAGGLCVCSRWAWEAIAPMQWTDNKAWFYVRDYLTLFPAAVCWYAAAVGRSTADGTDGTRVRRWLQWCTERPRRSAVVLGIMLTLACLAISMFVYRTVGHILDEADYLFQAKIFASGRLWIPPPPGPPEFFRTTYIILEPDRWYGSFFPGPSLSLVPGILLGVPFVVNPILSGLLLLQTFWAGRTLFDERTGLLAGLLMLVSPFVLLQGASYFSHVVTALCFVPAVVWLLAPSSLTPMRAGGVGLCAGGVLLCRPLSAALLAVFALLWWSILIVRGQSWKSMLRQACWMTLGALPGLTLLLGYNWALTGHPLVTPHHVALPDERIGPGFHMVTTTGINLVGLGVDLLGVPLFALLPLAAYVYRRAPWCLPLTLLVVVYIGGYSLYPYHGLSYGPRFYFEIAPFLLIAVAHGLRLLPSSFPARFASPAPSHLSSLVLASVAITLVISLAGVLPQRLRVFGARGAYFDIRSAVAPALEQPSLVFVDTVPDDDALAYLAAFQFIDVRPGLPTLFARDLGLRNEQLLNAYRGRQIYRLDIETDQLTPYVP